MSQHEPRKWCRWQGRDLFIKIFLQPNASRNALLGVHGEFIKVSVTTIPAKGAANKQLILLLSELFSVKKQISR
ncbi:MAG: hypothetical protein COB62_04480 [Piscirickettsiaceae bacterium]|nr:MAG: hypothetical protein COB62_04480 [Piscirickettsiaceae bacterium]